MSALGEFLDGVFARLRLRSLRMFWHVGFWGLALVIGIASGFAAVLFGMGIAWIQTWAYGTPDVNRLHSFAETLDWYWVVLIPTIGGVATGLIFHYLTYDGRVRSVADVIEGAALHDGVLKGKRDWPRPPQFDHPIHRRVHRTRGSRSSYRGHDFQQSL